jgi:hypothetical protein
MRGLGLTAFVIALVWTSAGFSATPRPKPHLRLLDRAPLTLKGTNFRARERVRVTVTTTDAQTRTVRTSRAGSFIAQFDGVTIGRCGGLSVRAVGARAEQATLKVLQSPDCAPGLGP